MFDSVEHSFEASEPASFTTRNPAFTQSTKKGSENFGLLLPYENFIGAVLGGSFRILKFLRSENHGDVYALEDLSSTSTRYEAKAYTLRGLPQNVRAYRVRNLKKLTNKPSFICSFDQNGRKFVINKLGERGEGEYTTYSRASDTNASELGRNWRWNSPEFDDAFPKLAAICESTFSCSSSSTTKQVHYME